MRKILIVLLVLVVLALGVMSIFMFGSYSEGFRAGTVVKLSKRGFIFKTTEGQLNLGGFSDDTNSGSPASALWSFSVDNSRKEVLEKLDRALLRGYRVKLYYKEKYMVFFWQGESKYFIYKVEEADIPEGELNSTSN